MKRIGIFILFDKDGVVDGYKWYLLDSLQTVLSDLIIVINGVIQEEALLRLSRYSFRIFIRKNSGYDAGAYKDVLTNQFERIAWKEWDEILLMNDTFYGPFFPWMDVFSEMEEKEADFWGLSSHAGGKLWDGSEAGEHVQAYFLAIKKTMFASPYWERFWKNFQYPQSYLEAVKRFEMHFTEFLVNSGFSFITWLDEKGGKSYRQGNRNPYLDFSYDIVRNCRFPVAKYRAFSVINYRNSKRLLDYIGQKTNYDKNMIIKHMERMEREGRFKPFGRIELEKFVASHRNIYIFGHGKYGKGMEQYFQEKGWRISGFIVSSPRTGELGLGDVDLHRNDGIIVAISDADEVRPVLQARFGEEQLLFARV